MGNNCARSSTLFIDEYFSPFEINGQSAIAKKLSSQKPLAIVQGDHFDGPSLTKPENFCFMNIGVDNLAVCQNIGFAADSLEPEAANNAWR